MKYNQLTFTNISFSNSSEAYIKEYIYGNQECWVNNIPTPASEDRADTTETIV